MFAASTVVAAPFLPAVHAADTTRIPAPAPGIDRPAALDVAESRRLGRPVYPAEAARKKLSGSVLVKARVEIDGHVSDVTVEHSSGYKAFDDSALAAVRHWVFSAAVHDGKPTPSYMLVPIDFSPPEKPRAR